jgi:hypothetical protein
MRDHFLATVLTGHIFEAAEKGMAALQCIERCSLR